MQLLGINLYEETPKAVRKALEPDWYPFGDYKKPAKGKPVKISGNHLEGVAYRIYQHALLPDKMPGDRYCFKNQTFWIKSEAF